MNNRLTAKLGQILIDANNNQIAPNAVADQAYEMLYMADVDGLVASELSSCMQSLAEFIEPPADDQNKTLAGIQFYFEPGLHTTVVTFKDGSQINIFIQNGMIFVADCNYSDLTERINNDDTDSFESYDTIDLNDYYKQSEYADYINSALLDISHRLFR